MARLIEDVYNGTFRWKGTKSYTTKEKLRKKHKQERMNKKRGRK